MDARPLIVVGHKNPDTDSICSAIAYARFKTLTGTPAFPYRAGNLNAQTRFVLDRFEVPAPPLLPDVHLRLADIMISGPEVITVKPDDAVGRARDVMLRRRFSFLPVTDDAGHCLGMLTILKLAEAPEEVRRMGDGYRITFNPEEFVARTGGWTAPGRTLPARQSATLRIPDLAASSIDGGRAVASVPSDAPRLVIVPAHSLAPRERAKLAGGKEDLFVVYGAERSGEHPIPSAGLVVFVPGNLLDVLVALYESSPIGSHVDSPELLLRSGDLVKRVEREINRYNAGGFIVTDEAGIMQGVVTRVNFLNLTQFRLVLVDHNELSQAVDGAEQAEIVEILDHHRLGARSTEMPITFINKVVGSTCTIVAEMYRGQGVALDRPSAGLLLSAILSDTVILKSPTTTDLDREIAPWLAEIAGVKIEVYGEEMFAAGSELAGLTAEAIVKQDQKIYHEAGFNFAVSQIEMVGFKSFHERSKELTLALEASRQKSGFDFACLLVTDITRETSLLMFAGSSRLAEAIRYPRMRNGLYEMHGMLSRKKQLIPYLLDLLKNL